MAMPVHIKPIEMMRNAGIPIWSIVSEALKRLNSWAGISWNANVAQAIIINEKSMPIEIVWVMRLRFFAP